jgi:M6 family metalloprotease-like protein
MSLRFRSLAILAFSALAVLIFSDIAAAQPNLTPYKPSVWSDKIVVSNVTGTNTDSTVLSAGTALYIDWAVINLGPAATEVRFYTDIYVDNALKQSWHLDSPLSPYYYVYVQDFSIGTLAAGTHTIRVVTDSTNAVTESNETDNDYTKVITVIAAPNLTPFQPAGWTDRIVVSKVTGTNTDSASLTSADSLYVDWAVGNSGSVATAARFYTELYVDNVLKQSWYCDPPLNAGSYTSNQDFSIGTLTAGTHAIRIVTDSANAVAEGNESDNQYTKTITILSLGAALNTCRTAPSPPVTGESFTFTLTGSGFDISTVQLFFLGPGCGSDTSCVVSNSALTTKTATTLVGTATLEAGSYTVQARNVSDGLASNVLPLYVAAQPGATSSTALILLVDFPDKPAQTLRDYFQSIMFGNHPAGAPQGSFRDYYHEVSYGKFDVNGSVNNAAIAWIRLPQSSTYYSGGCYGIPNDPINASPPCSAIYPQNAQKMVEDAVIAAKNSGLDFGPFDEDGDGLVDALFVVHAGQGGESSLNRSNIWSHAWATRSSINTGSTNSGGQPVYVSHYTTEPEYMSIPGDMTIGVFAHEYGHTRWGLPDLYDTDYSSVGIGDWSLMAGGSWNGTPAGSSPSHLDAWSKSFVGFLTPQKVTDSLVNEPIEQAETTADVYQLLDGSAATQTGEYFLVENRQRTGFDSGLPSSGLLIWHIDESKEDNRLENYPGCTGCSGNYKVQLVQADNRWDLEKNENQGDSGDPYPGTCSTGSCNTSFADQTSPNSKRNNGSFSHVTITGIGPSGSIMHATLGAKRRRGQTTGE